ncbi:hypothetical protein [Agrobacterium tumefaciens]|uniref:hypothetical protein n=1 Tax=Agrobacterium tumefaciens TaxID=358 RepID=UPI0021D2A1C8|nr:hypothetical protein [Agrobacterium tumefaciens]UXS09187.1 hypothetical protein FY155_06020 [Agrobacterium tumefaciens]UXS16546.1 hypothetical protein FY154_06015 [Agrobacterium tumefaciens]
MWQSFTTIILAGIGAFIANFAAKYIESWVRRNQLIEAQRDADLQDIFGTITQICDLSEKFWPLSAEALGSQDQILRSHIVALQHHLAELVAEVFTGKDKWDCDVQLHKLMMAATGGDFGEPDREAEAGRLTEIFIASRALNRSTKKARRKLPRRFLS